MSQSAFRSAVLELDEEIGIAHSLLNVANLEK